MVNDINLFNQDKTTCQLFLDGYDDPDLNFICSFATIKIEKHYIIIEEDNKHKLILPISLSQQLKDVLMEYSDYLENYNYNNAINKYCLY
jgi:hypothetical protein